MALQPKNAEELLKLLRERHALLLSARTSKNPGEFKDRNNRAGNTEFVDWQLVTGTLKTKVLSKIIIPTVYRDDYMGALKKLTKQRSGDAYIRILQRAWEFSSLVYDDSLDSMEQSLIAANAFLEPQDGYLKIIPR